MSLNSKSTAERVCLRRPDILSVAQEAEANGTPASSVKTSTHL